MDKDSGAAYKNTSPTMNIFVSGEIKENEYFSPRSLLRGREILVVGDVVGARVTFEDRYRHQWQKFIPSFIPSPSRL